MSIDRMRRIEQLTNMPAYLRGLSELVAREVFREELLSLEDTDALRGRFRKGTPDSQVSLELPFEDRRSDRFASYVSRMAETKDTKIYIWTGRSASCGAFMFDSIRGVEFDFSFDVDDGRALWFITEDLEDTIYLDFDLSDDGDRLLRVLVSGSSWVHCEY